MIVLRGPTSHARSEHVVHDSTDVIRSIQLDRVRSESPTAADGTEPDDDVVIATKSRGPTIAARRLKAGKPFLGTACAGRRLQQPSNTPERVSVA
jgi:hypothetical protein